MDVLDNILRFSFTVNFTARCTVYSGKNNSGAAGWARAMARGPSSRVFLYLCCLRVILSFYRIVSFCIIVYHAYMFIVLILPASGFRPPPPLFKINKLHHKSSQQQAAQDTLQCTLHVLYWDVGLPKASYKFCYHVTQDFVHCVYTFSVLLFAHCQ